MSRLYSPPFRTFSVPSPVVAKNKEEEEKEEETIQKEEKEEEEEEQEQQQGFNVQINGSHSQFNWKSDNNDKKEMTRWQICFRVISDAEVEGELQPLFANWKNETFKASWKCFGKNWTHTWDPNHIIQYTFRGEVENFDFELVSLEYKWTTEKFPEISEIPTHTRDDDDYDIHSLHLRGWPGTHWLDKATQSGFTPEDVHRRMLHALQNPTENLGQVISEEAAIQRAAHHLTLQPKTILSSGDDDHRVMWGIWVQEENRILTRSYCAESELENCIQVALNNYNYYYKTRYQRQDLIITQEGTEPAELQLQKVEYRIKHLVRNLCKEEEEHGALKRKFQHNAQVLDNIPYDHMKFVRTILDMVDSELRRAQFIGIPNVAVQDGRMTQRIRRHVMDQFKFSK